jgi:chemotaxis family two-component system response regulator Rcp1
MIDNAVRQISVLLVEDNPGDVRLMVEALKEGKVINNVVVASDGMQALAILHREEPFRKVGRPDLILLDLNLPKVSGREVLAEIKEDESLRQIPVVVLTTSDAEEDISRSYNLHANCYIKKPVDLDQFFSLIKSLNEFWFSVVRLPRQEG